jgi:phosphoadenosine phosphosulfate reductase
MSIAERPVPVAIGPLGPRFSDEELAELNRRFESLPASAIIRWAVDTFGSRLCLTASMQDTVLIDLAVKVEPTVEVVFLDTGYHFPETLETAEAVRSRYDLNLRVVRPDVELDDRWMEDPDGCCAVRKVEPLNRALAGKAAWLSGLRRDEAETRVSAPIVSRDKRGLVKVNPIATWTDADVAGYVADHELIANPLLAQGYPSIGCWPCTRQVSDGEDPRAGRWTGFTKTECGLHD